MYLTDNHKKFIKRVANIVSVVVIVVVGVMLEHKISTHFAKRDKEKADIVCPSLFSVARSPKDTLIVMFNVESCYPYLKDHLK
jgi:hypothetical protein